MTDSIIRRAWCTAKARYPGVILLIREGDQYFAFDDSATVENVTGRQTLPYSAEADQYITQLIRAGHKVAVCELTPSPAVVASRPTIPAITQLALFGSAA